MNVTPSASVRLQVITAGLLATFLSALDTSILSTVMPTIVYELGGLSLYSWVFAVYMVMTAVSMPVWGKLADSLGKEKLFITAVTLFLMGSVLCGLSRSMVQLIVFRGVQGIGSGGLSSVPFAMISMYYPPQERGKALGVLSSAWGISSVVGPAVGSAVVAALSWPWVFYINLPLGATAVALVARRRAHASPEKREPVDYPGAFLLMGAILSLMLASRSIGAGVGGWNWGTAVEATVVVSFLTAFIARERRARNPVLSLQFFSRRPFWLGSLLGFLSSFAMFGITAFMPLFAQSVLGGTALQAGLVVAPMSLAWSLASIIAGAKVVKTGENVMIRSGIFFMIFGLGLLLLTRYDSPLWYLILCVVLTGAGLGLQMPSLLLSAQHSLSSKDLGVATSTQMLARTIGGAIGVSVLGAALTGSMTQTLMDGIASGALPALPRHLEPLLGDPQKLLGSDIRPQLTPDQLTFVLTTFTAGLHRVFFGGLLVVLAALAVSRLLPPPSLHVHPDR